jgi:hypothetical protein
MSSYRRSGASLTDALLVLVLTPSIRAWLRENDPAALRQAETALLIHPDIDIETQHTITTLRKFEGE